MTAPSVAAASEYQKPPPKIASFTKTQPPIKEPTKPRTMSAMQPKPRPRAIFPASHPAMRPIRSQPTKRSEERRVGKECRTRGATDHEKKKEEEMEEREVR